MANETDTQDRATTPSTQPGDPVAEPAESAAAVAEGSAPTPDADGSSEGEEAEQSGDETEELRAALTEAYAAVEEARAQIESLKDQALRAAAETENVRKRADRSIENAHKYALERFVNDLLPAVDSFERAVVAAAAVKTTADEAVFAMAEGMELSLKLLTDAMARQGIEVVDPIGAPFDPNLHEAMTMVENAEAEPGSVIDVFQKGYTVNGRLARPARVIVAKAPAQADSDKA